MIRNTYQAAYYKIFIAICACFYYSFSGAQLAVIESKSPEQLVKSFLSGKSVEVSNIRFTGNPSAIAGFNAIATNLGVSSGILMTTGNVQTARGPNDQPSAGTDTQGAGDAALTRIAGIHTHDAAILEFDFVVASDSIEFRYVFASEEYNHAVDFPFNDVFAFFISGPGYEGTQNIALLPGTTTPIAINNVNNGRWKGFSYGPCRNCDYFVDNHNGSTIQYNGFTTVLTALAVVRPCQRYHIRLAIADAGDHIYDSAIFLEEGSFKSRGLMSVMASGPTVLCAGENVTLTSAEASNYLWNTGAISRSITVNQPGSYYLSVMGSGCVARSDTINVSVMPALKSPVIERQGTALKLINENEAYSYFWLKDGSPIKNAKANSLEPDGPGCYVAVASDYSGCKLASSPLCIDNAKHDDFYGEPILLLFDSQLDSVEVGMRWADEESGKEYRLQMMNGKKEVIYDKNLPEHKGIKLNGENSGTIYIKVDKDKFK